MKATVIYNKKAGFNGGGLNEVLEFLQNDGFSTQAYDLLESDLESLLEQPCDLVVAAGGDGTVKEVALKMAGSNLPLGIWPTGTSNNIASSFNIKKGYVFKNDQPLCYQPLRAGELQLRGEKKAFLESVGIGLLAEMMHDMIHQVDYKNEQEKLNKSLRLLRKMLREKKNYTLEIQLDGESYSGRYLAVEVLNTRYTGPKLLLAPQRPGAGEHFHVVLIENSQADALEAYLSDRLAGLQRPPQLPVIPARQVQFRGKKLRMHVDDQLYTLQEENLVSIQAASQYTRLCTGVLTEEKTDKVQERE